MRLPPPGTFAEGQRRLYGIQVAIAGIAFGLTVLTGGLVVLMGKWAPSLEPTQLYIIAGLLVAGCLNTTIVIVGLLLGGPVGRISGKVSDGTRTAEIDATGASQ